LQLGRFVRSWIHSGNFTKSGLRTGRMKVVVEVG
jgi:hypothetical protein